MLAKNPPVPMANDGTTEYAAPAAVAADKPAASGAIVTPVTVSPLIVPLTVKFVALVPAVKAVPYTLPGPVAVTVNALGLTVCGRANDVL